MAERVVIGDEDLINGIRIAITDRNEQGTFVWQLGTEWQGGSWELLEEGVQATPTMVLQVDHARLLLDKLTEHFHGATDVRLLRQDFEHEQARVDKMIDALITPPPPPTIGSIR